MHNSASEISVTTGWYGLPFQNYDPALGEFVQVDSPAHELRDRNKTVINALAGQSYARIARNKVLYQSRYVSDSGKAVKEYIKSVFSLASEQQQVSKLSNYESRVMQITASK